MYNNAIQLYICTLEKDMATHTSVLAWRIPGMGAWWAAIYGVTQSWTLLTWLSSSSSIHMYTFFFIFFCIMVYCRMGFPGDSVVKNPPANAEDAGDESSISGLGRSPGGGNGNPLQYSCLGYSRGQRSLAYYSPWSFRESDMAERLSTYTITGCWL